MHPDVSLEKEGKKAINWLLLDAYHKIRIVAPGCVSALELVSKALAAWKKAAQAAAADVNSATAEASARTVVDEGELALRVECNVQRIGREVVSLIFDGKLCGHDEDAVQKVINEKFVELDTILKKMEGEHSSSMQICVKTLTGKNMVFHMRPSDTILVLKHRILDEEGISPFSQKIYQYGRKCTDEQTLDRYMQLHLILHGPRRYPPGSSREWSFA